jgi:hypothetical protein
MSGFTCLVEVARHKLTRPGTPAIFEAHFPPAPSTPICAKPPANPTSGRTTIAERSGGCLLV